MMMYEENENWAPEPEDRDALERREEEAVEELQQQHSQLKKSVELIRKEVEKSVEGLRTATTALAETTAPMLCAAADEVRRALGSDVDIVEDDLRMMEVYKQRADALMVSTVQKLMVVELRQKAVERVSAVVRDWNFQADPLNAVVPNLKELLEAELGAVPAEVPEESATAHTLYLQWKQSGSDPLEDFVEDVDDETTNRGPDVPVKCYLTLLPLAEPMRSEKCGHIFSRSGLEHRYRASKRKGQLCPQAGCGKVLAFSDFKSSPALEEEVKQAIHRVEQLKKHQRSTQSTQMVDEL